MAAVFPCCHLVISVAPICAEVTRETDSSSPQIARILLFSIISTLPRRPLAIQSPAFVPFYSRKNNKRHLRRATGWFPSPGTYVCGVENRRSGGSLPVARALYSNERREIAAFAVDTNGNNHDVLLIPCDENHLAVAGCDYS